MGGDKPIFRIVGGTPPTRGNPANTLQTFQQYCRNELHGFLRHKINKLKCADIVFDIYKDHSIKPTTTETRGFGRRVKVSSKTPLPKNWQNFLGVNKNKVESFKLISD